MSTSSVLGGVAGPHEVMKAGPKLILILVAPTCAAGDFSQGSPAPSELSSDVIPGRVAERAYVACCLVGGKVEHGLTPVVVVEMSVNGPQVD